MRTCGGPRFGHFLRFALCLAGAIAACAQAAPTVSVDKNIQLEPRIQLDLSMFELLTAMYYRKTRKTPVGGDTVPIPHFPPRPSGKNVHILIPCMQVA